MDEADAAAFLQEIREQRLAAYKSCPSDLVEHACAEDVLRSEYAGRILPEMLQNAHDAIATEPIGSKGVGFKAVLNVCEGPRIHSGPLHCGFDRERSREEFQDAGLVYDNESVPLMRLPFPISETDEPQPVRDLITKFDTVVVLPFIGQSVGERFLKEWTEYAGDATLLLFLSSFGRIVWERRDGADTSMRVWHCERQAAVVEIHNGDDVGAIEGWRLWSSKRASVALRVDGGGAPVREQSYPGIRVFFQTDERSPIPILIHADFPLKEGRTNVLTEDEVSGVHIGQVTQEVARVVRSAFAEVSDGGLFLDLLRPRVELEHMGKLERELWNALKFALASLQIPGTDGLRLDQVRLRPADESHQASWWWWLDCDLWNAFKQILSDYRVGQLSGLFLLPAGIDTNARETTILYFNSDARLSIEELRVLPLLPVEGSGQPVAPGKSNVFFPPDDPPASPPEGIEVRFLDQRFAKAIESHKERTNLRRLLIELLGVSEFEPLTLISKAVLPVLRAGRQPNGLLDFLCRVVAPTLRKDDLIFDWRDPVRSELAERLLIPLRNGARLAAAKVYAGTEWTSDDFLDRAYGNCSDRGFLQPPPTDEDERKRWERLYKWIGVDWCPKVLPIVCFADKTGTLEGPRWDDGIFRVTNPPEHWPEYCKQFDHFENRSRKARLRQNWTLDGGSNVLMHDGALSIVNDSWAHYSKYRQATFFRSSNLRENYDNERRTGPSHLIWLFQAGRWIPVKGPFDKQKPEDVFARSEIVRELGGWGYELDGGVDEEFLKAIGVRSGWRQLDDGDWRRWLERVTGLADKKLNQDPELKRAVYRLYEAALKHWSGKDQNLPKPSSTWSGPVWCVDRRPDNTETWLLVEGREDVYFVDRADLDEVRLPSVWVFPVRLNRLERAAKERFGLNLLSEHLSGKPAAAEPMDSASQLVCQRVKDRLPAMNAYLEMLDHGNTGSLERLNLPDVRVVKELKVGFHLHERVVGSDLKLDAYHSWSDGGWTLWLDGAFFDGDGKPMTSTWEYTASALVYAADLALDTQPCLKDLLLYEGADLERKLLGLGVTKETVEGIITRASVEPPAPPEISSETEAGGNGVSETTASGATVPAPAGHGNGGHGGHVRGSGGGARGGTVGTSADQPGLEAQEWMRDELRKRLEPSEWNVSDVPTHDEELRETDIELHHDRFGTFHVEVKHSESDAIYWSENEVKKAQGNADRYFMVILTRDKDKNFEENWISDPLKDLKDLHEPGYGYGEGARMASRCRVIQRAGMFLSRSRRAQRASRLW